jgi:hypothetical protein
MMFQRSPTALLLAASLTFFGLTSGPAFAQDGAQTSPVEISFLPRVASKLPVKGFVVFRSGQGKIEPIRVAVTSPSTLSLKVPRGSSWEVSAELPGFWVPRKSLAVESPDQPTRLTLDLWPMGMISGLVKLNEKGGPLPKQILVKTLAVPSFLKRPSVPKGALDCPVDQKGAWRCSLPATIFDLVISAPGSAPSYRWRVQVPAGKTLSLGTIELKRGASVAGWVAVEEGRIEPRRCVARLAVLTSGGATLQSSAELSRTALQQEVREDGFFQFTGLAPGSYTLEAQQPGYPAARSLAIRVDPGVETFLPDPLVLHHALDLQFEIHPALDWLDRPWRAQVFKLGERPPIPLVFEGRADEEGRLIVAGQSWGRFRVSLQDSLGNRLYSGEHSVESAAGAPQSIEVRFVTLSGKVRLGEEPLDAVLWFGGRSGTTSIKMEADAGGQFHGVLPHEGPWRIEVEAKKPAFSTWTQGEVRANRAGKASLDIVLPDTRVFGRVVDEQEKPVPAADVSVRGERLDLHEVADPAGAFEVRGLPEGGVWLGAEATSRVSDRVSANLVEGRAVGPVELKLHPMKRLNGSVLSSLGPVVGARVMILARTPDGGGAVATTDTDGAFQVDLPQAASRITAIASAPGFALRAFDATADPKPLLLQVTEDKGNLEVALPLTREDLLRENLVLVAFQNGLPIPTWVLSQWASDHGLSRDGVDRTWRVPDVAPGEYRVCFVPRALELLVPWSSVPEGASCDSGVLSPGATLSLKPSRPG